MFVDTGGGRIRANGIGPNHAIARSTLDTEGFVGYDAHASLMDGKVRTREQMAAGGGLGWGGVANPHHHT